MTPRLSLAEESGRKNRHARKDSRLNAAEMLRSLSPAPRRLERSNSGSAAANDDSTARKAKVKERRRLSEQARAGKVFEDSVKLLWETVVTARAVILSANGESPLEAMMRRIQTSDTSADSESGGNGHISTASLLRAMPSSQILQAYLPDSIKKFSPFIGNIGQAADKSVLRGLLDRWFESSLERLGTHAKGWLGGLETVTDVWQVKRQSSIVLDRLQELEQASLGRAEADRVVDTLATAFIDRARNIWQSRLDAAAVALKEGLQDDIEALMQGNDNVAQGQPALPPLVSFQSATDRPLHADLHPSLSFFAPIAFPDHRSTTSSFTSTDLPAFTSALKKRLQSRTPILDRRLAELEQMAAEIRSDLRSLKQSPTDATLLDQYRQSATVAAKGMVNTLSKALETVREQSTDKAERATTCLFVGRLALALMTQSKALSILLLSSKAVDSKSRRLHSFDFLALIRDLHLVPRRRVSLGYSLHCITRGVEGKDRTRRTRRVR